MLVTNRNGAFSLTFQNPLVTPLNKANALEFAHSNLPFLYFLDLVDGKQDFGFFWEFKFWQPANGTLVQVEVDKDGTDITVKIIEVV